MNRIISDELYERIQKSLEDVFDARLAEDLRTAPQTDRPMVSRVWTAEEIRDTMNNAESNMEDVAKAVAALQLPQPVVGQVGEAVETISNRLSMAVDFLQDNYTDPSLLQLANRIKEVMSDIESLRTKPKAPVVEVPSEKELADIIWRESSKDDNPSRVVRAIESAKAIHALLQRTVGGGK